ncbi:efflux RND transporter periplasmic adaptor subunit [Tuwongella immobilis]|uniref:Uncharacterized protein n=1 Tax=Tuwongella immobilis TaxID=692036 RepID=A0A6C2YRI0_9BACT|nr:efflux RND transporter periplasmic adaptor subunit [Tuwongella immobilis]VIP04270.1 hemolysin secretion protein d : Efflux transporter, RND family, MFP subunit OS=Pirellula staleyi (strain ATCC 27377 / DSM 6068 / ICPB 4128) GN=Psta_2289 PE=4 SV=1: HlyD [Tuwongella immobilis]VTS05903.1 hemolysin secretion protein d : Efflux transporter, RND family, MFP subunit OS=Pirellula staleyi (strain ATCC 27377 / DSM 6068 / ICPB 4128) GN=Psta_2289 PE=4 SV=1: HlyD [Tuwongella immobilis]
MSMRHTGIGSILLLGMMFSLTGCGGRPKPIVDTSPVLVTVATPFTDSVTTAVELTGVTDAVETVKVRPRVSGYITAVKFKEGDKVEAGKTVLFEIDPVTYDADLKKAKAQAGVSQAKLELAKANRARTEFTFKKGASTQQELDTDVAQEKVAAAELDVVKNEITNAQQNLDWCRVIAPITGIVDKAYLTVGNVATGGLSQGTELTTIVNVNPKIYAYFDIDDQSVLYYRQMIAEGKIKPRKAGELAPMEMLISVKLPNGGETDLVIPGEVDFITPTYNASTGTRQIRGIFPNDGKLDAGLFVRGRIAVGDPISAILVPESAIITEQSNKLVYVVTADNKVEARQVILGPLHRGLRVVGSGLKTDERIIIRGLQRVTPGQPVEPQDGKIEPMAAK